MGTAVGILVGAKVKVGVLLGNGEGVAGRFVGLGLAVGRAKAIGPSTALRIPAKSGVGGGSNPTVNASQGITTRYKTTAASSRPMMMSHCLRVIDESDRIIA